MPQVDLETLVSACAGASCDRKIVCETLASAPAPAAAAADDSNHRPTESGSESDPPESFWLSKDAELDWFDRNAFIERKDSTKGNSTNLNPNINPNSHPSNSQRFSNLKTKASIIGLPLPQKSCFVDAKNRRNCKPGTRLFTKRSGSSGKSDSSLFEPSSPKVSCIGRVRSKRDRNRRLKNRQRSTGRDCKKEKPETEQKPGFFAGLRAIFWSGSKKTHNNKDKNDSSQAQRPPVKRSTWTTSDITDRLPATDRDAAVPPRKSVELDGSDGVEAAGLGGMKRFASGRKSESWASSIDVA
uniref:Uncharacterized protein n=1 Tax=Rhizophora mucronata TaxID=61149 RepID=A0A2P2QSY1_RHIMU